MKISYHRFKNRIKDSVVKYKSQRDQPHSEAYRHMLQLLNQLSDQEKDSLQAEIRKQLAKSGETLEYAELVFNEYFQDYIDHAGGFPQIRIMELGPGTNLAVGLYFLLAGAAQYVAVDALAAFPERPKEFYQQVIAEIKKRPRLIGRSSIKDSEIDSILQIGETCVWNSQRLQYLTPVFAEKIPIDDASFDYIFSNASFEHFENPDVVIREVYRLLKPGGFTVHQIDLRDHIDFEKPLEFLKVSESDYEFTSPYGTNRWRRSDFETVFREAGFRKVDIGVSDSHSISDAEFSSIASYFTKRYHRNELEIVGIKVYATK
jgi:SAM-dependent methyltransferase